MFDRLPLILLCAVVAGILTMALWAEMACTVAVFMGVALLPECQKMDLRGLLLEVLAAVLAIGGFQSRGGRE